jgi:trehalose 6-phosphate phosphatase
MSPAPRGARRDLLEGIRTLGRRAGIFLDFDGTLAEIVPTPDLAAPLPGVEGLLERLADHYGIVAIVSGRPTAQLRALLDAPNVALFGLYGLDALHPDAGVPPAAREAIGRAIAPVAGAWLEEKGAVVAVHYRQAPDPAGAERILSPILAQIGHRYGLALLRGKMVLELAPATVPGKGEIVLMRARDGRLAGCLYAGDDVADLEAFAALDELARGGMATVKVAVGSPEVPSALATAADVTVDGPLGLVSLLSELEPG